MWSPLERARLGPWRLGARLVVGFGLLPAVLGGGWPAAILGPWVGAGCAAASDAWWRRRAWRAGWRTCAWHPTTPAVWRTAARHVGLDPRWRGVRWERHTVLVPWHRPGEPPEAAAARFVRARGAEWRRWAAGLGPLGLSVTYGTLGGVDPAAVGGAWAPGVPFGGLKRAQARALGRAQRRLFGGPVPRRGPPLEADAAWRTVVLPGRRDARMEEGFSKFMWAGVGLVLVLVIIGVIQGILGPGAQQLAQKAINWLSGLIP